MTVTKVISGGQIGADIAGLRAAKELGIETGGWMPKYCNTLDGPKPEYLEEYGMQECRIAGYPERTSLNVRDSDGTVRFAYNFKSPGEKCTLKYIKQYDKPRFDVFLHNLYTGWHVAFGRFDAAYFGVWLDRNSISTLNVAGNADKEIEEVVQQFLLANLKP